MAAVVVSLGDNVVEYQHFWGNKIWESFAKIGGGFEGAFGVLRVRCDRLFHSGITLLDEFYSRGASIDRARRASVLIFFVDVR